MTRPCRSAGNKATLCQSLIERSPFIQPGLPGSSTDRHTACCFGLNNSDGFALKYIYTTHTHIHIHSSLSQGSNISPCFSLCMWCGMITAALCISWILCFCIANMSKISCAKCLCSGCQGPGNLFSSAWSGLGVWGGGSWTLHSFGRVKLHNTCRCYDTSFCGCGSSLILINQCLQYVGKGKEYQI